jgi:hypothetical protein
VLELTYLRPLSGAKVAAKAVEEMQRMGFTNQTKLQQWQPQLAQWFKGINKNTKIAAMRNANGSTTFIKNGKKVLGTIEDTEFTSWFFNIWLGKKTLEPTLRQQLLGKTT